MGKYIKYKRISDVVTPEQIDNYLDSFIKEGWEIISYNERIMEKTPILERVHIAIIVGKLNSGK